MSQQDNYENGRGCLGVVALLMAVLLVGGFAAKNLPNNFPDLILTRNSHEKFPKFSRNSQKIL